MKVNNRDNLAAYITVDSDPGSDYGKMTVFKLPTNSTIQGPTQVFNRFSSEPAISRDISLLNQGGSQVLHGNLLTLPIGNTFLYVEPLYVARAGGGFPLLQAILVAYGDQLGYGSSVSDALTHLAPVGQVPPSRSSASGNTLPSLHRHRRRHRQDPAPRRRRQQRRRQRPVPTRCSSSWTQRSPSCRTPTRAETWPGSARPKPTCSGSPRSTSPCVARRRPRQRPSADEVIRAVRADLSGGGVALVRRPG